MSEYSYFNLGEYYISQIIRYSNHPDSNEWIIYDSSEKIDGQALGCLKIILLNTQKKKFPNSDVGYYDNDNDYDFYIFF